MFLSTFTYLSYRLAVPYFASCISEADFEAQLPLVLPDDYVSLPFPGVYEAVAPVHYHRVMAQIARTYYRFRIALRARVLAIEDVVKEADRQLANIIDKLPPHLQPDSPEHSQNAVRDENCPWIAWQRWDLCLVLLYYRLNINRTLQKEWLASPDSLSGPRSICISSAKSIVWITQQSILPIAKRRQWYYFSESPSIISINLLISP